MKDNHSNSGALIGGTLLIVFGVLATLQQIFPDVFTWSLVWPITVIVFGSLFFVGMFSGGRGVSGLAVPGSIIMGIGLLLLYQNLTDHWSSWAYGWTLIVLFVGVGIYIMGWYAGDDGQKTAGKRVMRVGFTLFVIFGAFFELLVFGGSSFIRSMLCSVLMILLGIYMIVMRLGLFNRRKPELEMPASMGETGDNDN